MNSALVLVSCLCLAVTVTDARRRKRAVPARVQFEATPLEVTEGHTDELLLACTVSKLPEHYPSTLSLTRVDEDDGGRILIMQLAQNSIDTNNDSRISIESGLAGQDEKESYVTITIQQPTSQEQGQYNCQYDYFTADMDKGVIELFTSVSSVNVTVTDLPKGVTDVPPPVTQNTGCACLEVLDAIDTLKASMESSIPQTAGQGQDEACRVSFTARLREERGYLLRSDQTILFNSVITNKGEAYDVTSGKFTAPCTGQYFFSVTVTALHASSGSVEAVIRKNEENQARSFAYTEMDNNELRSGSTSVVISMVKGEQVDVLLLATSHGEYMGSDHTVFTGFSI